MVYAITMRSSIMILANASVGLCMAKNIMLHEKLSISCQIQALTKGWRMYEGLFQSNPIEMPEQT